MTLVRAAGARRSHEGLRGLGVRAGCLSGARGWVRFVGSWTLAMIVLGVGLPRAVKLSWHVVMPTLESVPWSAVAVLVALWCLGMLFHSFLLTAAAPDLTPARAITLNVTGSAVANVVPLGGAAGVELNRRMMKAWGIDSRSFSSYLLLINLWGIGCKLLLPSLAVLALGQTDQHVVLPVRAAALGTGAIFIGLVALATTILLSSRGAAAVGTLIDRTVDVCRRLTGRGHDPRLAVPILDIRRDCHRLVAIGWLRMSVGIFGYVALQCLLLGVCLHLTSAGISWPGVLAGFAVERTVTLMPVTPGGIGVGDLGLVSVLMALGGVPAGVTAAALLYRAFVFAVQVPVGGCILGGWLLVQHLKSRADEGRAG
jgi:uncharacterized membrane protein YbhN (UPF0104 family)